MQMYGKVIRPKCEAHLHILTYKSSAEFSGCEWARSWKTLIHVPFFHCGPEQIGQASGVLGC